MNGKYRWDPCISHQGDEVIGFISEYFSSLDRRVLLIAGAGFDPRSTAISSKFAAVTKQLRALFIKENRPNPPAELLERAAENLHVLGGTITEHMVMPIDIFGEGGAVTGGRNIVEQLRQQPLEEISDVVIDTSALSVGASFPAIRYFVERFGKETGSTNLHVFVAHNPELDADIQSIPSDVPDFVHGFRGRSTLDDSASATKLWLPLLATKRRGALNLLYEFVEPHDICPILPFPATDPRLVDKLARGIHRRI